MARPSSSCASLRGEGRGRVHRHWSVRATHRSPRMSLLPSSLPSSPLFCSRRRVAIASGKRRGRFKALGESSSDREKEVCLLRDYSDRLSKYEQVWDLQKRLVQSKTLQLGANENENRDRDGKGEGEATTCHDLILVQHEPVYTLGAGSTLAHVKFDVDDPPFPIFRTERGGEVTYHGPGQLVLYPILNLRQMKKEDLHWYLRTLEEVLIETLGAFGLKGERIPGLTGVWVDGAKVAAIGVRATRWVTYHGLALNVTTDLSPFQDIVPCGIEDRPVTSMHDLLKNNNSKNKDVDQEVLVKQVAQKLLEHFALLFDVDYVVI